MNQDSESKNEHKKHRIEAALTRNRTLSWALLIIILIVCAYYVQELIGYDPANNKWDPLLQLCIRLLTALATAMIVAIFVNARLNSIQQDVFLKTVRRETEKVQKNAIDTVIGNKVEPGIFELLKEKIYDQNMIRKNAVFKITFKWEDGILREFIKSTDEIHNISSTIVNYDFSTITTEDDNVNLISAVCFSPTSINNSSIEKVKTEKSREELRTKQEAEDPIKIPPNKFIKIVRTYELFYGIKDGYYHNAIGISESTIGIEIQVDKPKGYNFDVFSYSGHEFKRYPKSNVINETTIYYNYPGAFFPGTGIEYFLKKID